MQHSKVVPRQFYQLLTIQISEYGVLVPAFYIAMTAKIQALFYEVFTTITSIFPAFKTENFVSDSERALMNAIEKTWPESQLFGCHFHFTQALYRKFQNLGGVTQFK